jgi:hypothetical protein
LLNEGLLPRCTYTYQLQKLGNDSSVVETSASVQLTTMDTTSHNFTWQIDTLGTHSSVLYDLAIINDTLVYAVGEIFHRDSSENWTFFNLAKWNGREWTLHRVYYRGNNIIHTRWILAFAWNDIWITPYTHWDGMTWREVPFDPIFSGVGTNKAWGTSSGDFYVVGNGGFIAHYDGVQWRRVESGTGLDIVDVFGSTNQSVKQILAVASRAYATRDRAILHIDALSGQATTLSDSGITQPLEGIWFVGGRIYYVVGSGIYRRWSVNSHESWRALHTGVTPNYSYSVRGTAMNDLIVVGAFGDVIHFNGLNWKVIQELRTNGNFYRVAVTSRLVVAIGFRGGREVVVRGYR